MPQHAHGRHERNASTVHAVKSANKDDRLPADISSILHWGTSTPAFSARERAPPSPQDDVDVVLLVGELCLEPVARRGRARRLSVVRRQGMNRGQLRAGDPRRPLLPSATRSAADSRRGSSTNGGMRMPPGFARNGPSGRGREAERALTGFRHPPTAGSRPRRVCGASAPPFPPACVRTRRISIRPHRSGAESPMAPKSAFSGGVWNGPGARVSAGSRANPSGCSSQSASYSKDALSRPLRMRDPQSPDGIRAHRSDRYGRKSPDPSAVPFRLFGAGGANTLR